MIKTLFKLGFLAVVLGGAAWGSLQFVNKAEAQRSAPGGGGGGGAARGEAPPLQVDALAVEPERMAWRANAVGTLMAWESVAITSEAPRRLVAITIEEGQFVRAGDPLFLLDDADLQAEVRQLEAQVAQVQARVDRLQRLKLADAVSVAEFDDARLEAASLQARIERVKVDIDRCSIRAPFDGIVGIRNVSLGAIVERGDVMTTLTNIEKLRVDFKLPEKYARIIQVGSGFRFRSAASAQWQDAQVSVIQPEIDMMSRSLVVRGTTPNPGGKLLPGSFIEVEVDMRAPADVLMVPTHAVIPTATGAQVYIAEGNKAVIREIMIGERTADRVEVLSGLKPGELVVTSNLLRLKPNARVEVVRNGGGTTL